MELNWFGPMFEGSTNKSFFQCFQPEQIFVYFLISHYLCVCGRCVKTKISNSMPRY